MGIGEDSLELLGSGTLRQEVEGSFAVRERVCVINRCGFVDNGRGFLRGRLGWL